MLPMVFENMFDEEQWLALPVPNTKLYTLYARYDLDTDVLGISEDKNAPEWEVRYDGALYSRAAILRIMCPDNEVRRVSRLEALIRYGLVTE